MHSELITQRIKYLVEEGGLFDDPLADIRRDMRIVKWTLAGVVIAGAIGLAVLALR
jgi:hypothetical protein